MKIFGCRVFQKGSKGSIIINESPSKYTTVVFENARVDGYIFDQNQDPGWIKITCKDKLYILDGIHRIKKLCRAYSKSRRGFSFSSSFVIKDLVEVEKDKFEGGIISIL